MWRRLWILRRFIREAHAGRVWSKDTTGCFTMQAWHPQGSWIRFLFGSRNPDNIFHKDQLNTNIEVYRKAGW